MPTAPIEILVSDDSGPLGLVDCAAYSTFVDVDWQYEQLLNHFRELRTSCPLKRRIS